MKTSNTSRHAFQISSKTHKRIWYLCADTIGEKDQWMRVINQVIETERSSDRELIIRLVQARDLIAADSGNTSDPYVILTVGTTTVKSAVIKKNLNPVWNEEFKVNATGQNELKMEVFDKDVFKKDDPLGEAVVSLEDLLCGIEKNMWVQLPQRGQVNLSLTLVKENAPDPIQLVYPVPKVFKLRESAFRGNFTIRDEDDQEILFAKGLTNPVALTLSFGVKVALFDKYENELLFIHQKNTWLMPQFKIYLGGKGGDLMALIKQEFAFKTKLTVTMGDGSLVYVEGDFWEKEFRIFREDENRVQQDICHISRKIWNWSGNYGCQIEPGENILLPISLAIVVDKILELWLLA